jgi:hypothetical protein
MKTSKNAPTKRSQIIDFVRQNGITRRKDIVRFIVDLNYGEGTYDSDTRRFRGYYASGFSGKNSFAAKYMGSKLIPGSLMQGKKEHLIRLGPGHYYAVSHQI